MIPAYKQLTDLSANGYLKMLEGYARRSLKL